MFKNKKFECYLLKNRIPGVVLAVLMTVFMLMMAGRFELLNRLDSKTYRTLNEIESISNPYGSDVKITVDRADYLGYDYFVDSERQGSYYICQQDGRYAILLLKSNDDVVLNYTIKGRMISGGSEYSSIIDGITSDMGIAAAQLDTRMYPLPKDILQHDAPGADSDSALVCICDRQMHIRGELPVEGTQCQRCSWKAG